MSSQISQTTEDRQHSVETLKNSSSELEFPNSVELVDSRSLLNQEEIKQVDLSACWFIEFRNQIFQLAGSRNQKQLVPKQSNVVRSKESGQLLRISAVSGG